MLKKETGFKKISSDRKYGLILIQYAGTTGLTGIHVKKTWIFNWEQAQYHSKVWAPKAKAFLPCIKWKVVYRKRNVIVLLVTALVRQILKYFVQLLLRRILTEWNMFRGERSGEWKVSHEELEMFSLVWRIGPYSGSGRKEMK